MNRDPERIPARERRTARPNRKRLLAVQAMVGETAWLDGQLIWHEKAALSGKPAAGEMAPAVGDLALAQRRLNQIARYPIAARRAVGDLTAWLAGRRARLDLAKQVHAIRAPDLPALAATSADPSVIARLVGLLAAEALCVNSLPAAPGSLLLARGERAAGALEAALSDTTLPLAGRALAALVLGAIRRHGDESQAPPAPVRQDIWMQRAYAWGRARGWPPDPALVVTLLANPDGPALAGRYLAMRAAPGPFALPADLLRGLLARGISPGTVIALAEAAQGATPLAERILDYRDELPQKNHELHGANRRVLEERYELAQQLLEERRALLKALAALFESYARAADAALITLIARLAHTMLDLGPPAGPLLVALRTILQEAQGLPTRSQRPYLQLLLDTMNRSGRAIRIAPSPGTPSAKAG